MTDTTLAAVLDAVRMEELTVGYVGHWADRAPAREPAAVEVPADMSTASVDFWARDAAAPSAAAVSTGRAGRASGAVPVAHWARA